MSKYFLFFISLLFFSQSYADKIKIEMFTESLCPDCMDFLTSSFKTAFNTKDIEFLAEFHIYPYGNAHQTFVENKWKFQCQHGDIECSGNLIQNCAMNQTNLKTGVDFILCFEENIEAFDKDVDKTGQHCSDQLNLDFVSLKNCMTSDLGNKVQHEVAVKTETLDPPKSYVPWIVVNGEHNVDAENQIFENMVGFICKNYKGDAKIDACLNKNSFLKN